jgi:hypothetical protein
MRERERERGREMKRCERLARTKTCVEKVFFSDGNCPFRAGQFSCATFVTGGKESLFLQMDFRMKMRARNVENKFHVSTLSPQLHVCSSWLVLNFIEKQKSDVHTT